MIIPYGIHDVHGTINWLRPQPTVIPWIPHGIPDGFHMEYLMDSMDSIWNNLGKVKTSPLPWDEHQSSKGNSWSWAYHLHNEVSKLCLYVLYHDVHHWPCHVHFQECINNVLPAELIVWVLSLCLHLPIGHFDSTLWHWMTRMCCQLWHVTGGSTSSSQRTSSVFFVLPLSLLPCVRQLSEVLSFVPEDGMSPMLGGEVCVATPSLHALNICWGSLTHVDLFYHLTRSDLVGLMCVLCLVISFQWRGHLAPTPLIPGAVHTLDHLMEVIVHSNQAGCKTILFLGGLQKLEYTYL